MLACEVYQESLLHKIRFILVFHQPKSIVGLKEVDVGYFTSKDRFIWDQERMAIRGLQQAGAMVQSLYSPGRRTLLWGGCKK